MSPERKLSGADLADASAAIVNAALTETDVVIACVLPVLEMFSGLAVCHLSTGVQPTREEWALLLGDMRKGVEAIKTCQAAREEFRRQAARVVTGLREALQATSAPAPVVPPIVLPPGARLH